MLTHRIDGYKSNPQEEHILSHDGLPSSSAEEDPMLHLPWWKTICWLTLNMIQSVRISVSASLCAADWLSAVDLITLCLLAVTLWWEADMPNPRGNICMSACLCMCQLLYPVHRCFSHVLLCEFFCPFQRRWLQRHMFFMRQTLRLFEFHCRVHKACWVVY